MYISLGTLVVIAVITLFVAGMWREKAIRQTQAETREQILSKVATAMAVTKISPCGTYFEMIEDKGARAKDQRPDV